MRPVRVKLSVCGAIASVVTAFLSVHVDSDALERMGVAMLEVYVRGLLDG
jgi:hypothetical protein